MVQESRRTKRSRKQQLLGSHQRCWLWGRHVVRETLKAGKWPIRELHLADRLGEEELDSARQLAARRETPVRVEPWQQLSNRCRTAEHQGYLAKMPPYPYDDLEQLLASRGTRPLYALLDGLQDPYNFGAVIRCAESLGLDGVMIPGTHQVGVTSLVARASAGAVNYLPIVRLEEPVATAGRLKELGLRLIAAHEKARSPVSTCNLARPTTLVIGSEGTGIRTSLLQMVDEQVRIPLAGRLGSLNAAVAAGIVFYEARRQRMRPTSE